MVYYVSNLSWNFNLTKLPFLSKNAFFGQKKAFFQKVHFIQKCSVTQNAVFQCVKNNFLLAEKKLIFFTILNLTILNVWNSIGADYALH